MHEQLSEALWQERLLAVLGSVFSVMSVLIVAIGLYGLLAYDASQGRREFGIRCALGAQRVDVGALLVKDLGYILLPGLALGFSLGLLLTRIIATALYGVRAFDLLSMAGALTTVIIVGIVAAWLPVQRAMNIEPALVLREE